MCDKSFAMLSGQYPDMGRTGSYRRLALVRPAGRGISIATDAQGRVLSMVDDTPTDSSALSAAVPMVGATTLYPRIGDAFA